MKRLTLIRHAKSSWADATLADFERPLNQRGLTDAPLMAQRLVGQISKPELLLYSPAERTRQTADYVIGGLQLQPAKAKELHTLYLADKDELLALIHSQPPSRRHLLLIGHTPGLLELINYLVNEPIEHLPTSAVMSLLLPNWHDLAGNASVAYHDWPKKSRD